MKKTKERTEEPRSAVRILRPIGIGVLVGGCVCMVLLLLFALIFLKVGSIPEQAQTPIVIGISALGAFSAGLVTGRLARQQGLLWGSVAGMSLFVLLLASSVSFGNLFSWVALARMGVMVLSGGIGGLIAVNRKRKRK